MWRNININFSCPSLARRAIIYISPWQAQFSMSSRKTFSFCICLCGIQARPHDNDCCMRLYVQIWTPYIHRLQSWFNCCWTVVLTGFFSIMYAWINKIKKTDFACRLTLLIPTLFGAYTSPLCNSPVTNIRYNYTKCPRDIIIQNVLDIII